ERALFQLALVERSLGRLAEAQQHLEEMLQIARDSGDRNGAGRAIGSLAIVMSALGDLDEAIRLTEEMIAHYAPDGVENRAGMYLNLGIYQRLLGRERDAERSYETAGKIGADSTNWRLQLS